MLASWSTSLSQDVRRIPQQRPRNAALVGTVKNQDGRGIPGAAVRVRNQRTNRTYTASSNGEGIFRLRDLPPGEYEISVEREGFHPIPSAAVVLKNAEVRLFEAKLEPSTIMAARPSGPSGVPGPARGEPQPDLTLASLYPGLRMPQPMAIEPVLAPVEVIPTEDQNFAVEDYRWAVDMPDWQRYDKPGEFPYVKSHWYDPFDRNRVKGDYPIFGKQWFFNFTGTSFTGVDARRLPTPSNLGAENPNSAEFFGRGQQALATQTFRFSFDLFHGDTSFRPVDFRVRVTPAVNLNYLQTRERGIVNVDVRKGTNRFDAHAGLQEAFVEAKLKDLSPNFDFASVRAGIQPFTSDFRGFIFFDEQPGIRIFGNLRNNRINYNLAYFYMLEKDTNSLLNTFDKRHQQVYVANVYIQDFIKKGYTNEFSFHYNRDDGDIHFDENGFLVRPAPIGNVVVKNGIPKPHNISAYYLGWASNGHIGRLNVSHAFYQVLGTDDFNPIAGRPVDINARMGALELSVDKDWLRFRTSVFYTTGDSDPRVGASRSGTARGFDSIVDDTHFAGTSFSFWNREGIRLTSTGVGLVNEGSLIPDLRSAKQEGQANFVNPGIRLYNVGVDADITPKLRGFVNASYLQFDRTEPLQLLLFQSPVHHSIGTDFGLGIVYRPPLTENIVLTTGVSTLVPGTGLREVYNSRTLVSGFVALKLQF
ncbi:MAG TPA: carboxypeptidase-like regulatory domain-containing protein [Terriglobales bacterium]|nr:carboxypeptidase-like regulatory domain-containing protein [Terriglobales bacterium]